jgi:Cft2 family RNA processing exonuclease
MARRVAKSPVPAIWSRRPASASCLPNHKDRAATVAELWRILATARADGGKLVIPPLAVGRSQVLLYWFAGHLEDWNVATWTIFLDSPMAAKVMAVSNATRNRSTPGRPRCGGGASSRSG